MGPEGLAGEPGKPGFPGPPGVGRPGLPVSLFSLFPILLMPVKTSFICISFDHYVLLLDPLRPSR